MPKKKIFNVGYFYTENMNKIVNKNLKYNEIDEWDSIGHMTLISSLEEKFNISFETDDVIDFSSYPFFW